MRTHVIKVRGRAATCSDRMLVAGTSGVDEVLLDLDGEWAGLDVSVTFRGSGATVTPPLEDLRATVPWECLVDHGPVTVAVVGRRDGAVLRTAEMGYALMAKPSMDTGASEAPKEPTKTEAEQLVEDLRRAKETLEASLAKAEEYVKLLEEHGIAEWGIDAESHRLTIGPIKRKEAQSGAGEGGA